MKKQILSLLLILLGTSWSLTPIQAQQACDCPYPMLFLHGFIGSQDNWTNSFADPDFTGIWGPATDTFFAVVNANTGTNIAGADGILGNNDDDVLVQFVNETNDLAPGCMYLSDWENFWNEDINNPVVGKNSGDPIDQCADPSGFFGSDSDSNESAFFKQAYAFSHMVDKVLAANPTKDKVIVVGHSAGGCLVREYLQRDDAPTPSGRWWIGNEHRIKKLVTMGSPHLGSNFFGNPFPDAGKDETLPSKTKGYPLPTKDLIPDINCELARDLRHSTLGSSLSCSFGFGPNHGVYLFGGDENCISDGYHNDDVNCDGDENDVIVGVNIDGTLMGQSSPQDGTYDNPAMPLPTDVKYVWLTHDVGSGGDLVVDLSRQWIYNNNIPYPLDPAAPGPYYLTDTLLGNTLHPIQPDDFESVVRALDEGDYPYYAFEIDANVSYNGTATVRSAHVSNTTQADKQKDADWFSVTVPANSLDTLHVIPTPNLSGTVDLYTTYPGDFATAIASLSVPFNVGSGPIEIPYCNTNGAMTYYFRITHNSVDYDDWKTPYCYTLKSNANFLDANANTVPDDCELASLALKWMLEGPYNNGTGLMKTLLNTNNLLPLSTPYATAPYNAPVANIAGIPAQMVDWVLVEIRSNLSNTSKIDQQSALLMNDGSIKALDGVSDLTFNIPPNTNYYVVVRHRNHLDVMTATAIQRSAAMTYDFSTAVPQAYGTNQQKLIGSTAVAYAGDMTQNLTIQTTDYDLWQFNAAILNEYRLSDINMDGTVQTTDYDLWFLNKAKLADPNLAY